MSNLAQSEVVSRLVKVIGSTLRLPPEHIDGDADLETLGIDSIILMELIENIDQEFSVSLTPAQIAGVTTLSSMAEVLASLQPGAPPAQARAATPAAVAAPRDVLSYIQTKYAVDLSHRAFNSVDEIADALVTDHSAALLRHFGTPSATGNGASDGTSPPATRAAAAPAEALDVAIVGMSCRLPDAADLDAFWSNLLAEKRSVREIPESRWNWAEHFSVAPAAGKSVSKWGALLEDVECFDAGFFGIPPQEARAMDPQQRLLLQETYRAVENAGMDITKLAGTRTGVFMGYEYSEYEQRLRARNNQHLEDGPLFSSSSPAYYLSNRISFLFDLRGPSETLNMQCASSAAAINRAWYSLLNGESDLAIAGGVSLNLFAGDYVASSQYGLLSADGTTGVFDNDASGFTRGEAVAVVVLKPLEAARRDRDRIYGIIKSCHHSYRGRARSISEVRHEALTSVLSDCYRKASVDPETVRYIEVDGYATKWADSIEYEGIKGAIRQSAQGGKHCALGSVKGNIGNVEAASGVTSLIKVALALHHKKFPATISKRKLSSFIDVANSAHPLFIADQALELEALRTGSTPVRAGINSFADSGSNVHILLEEYLEARSLEGDAEPVKQLCIFSARSPERLEAAIERHIEALARPDGVPGFADLVYTLQTGREPMHERLAIVASSCQELEKKLTEIRTSGLRAAGSLASRGIYHGKVLTTEKHSLASVITADMVRTALQQGSQTRQWQQVALLWVNGVAIDWDQIWADKAVRRASLPGYPFARERHWMEEGAAVPLASVEPGDAPIDTIAATPVIYPNWYFDTLSGDSTAPAQALPLSATEKAQRFLQQEVSRQLRKPVEEIGLDVTLIDLGMSSVAIAALIHQVDRLLQTQLSPSVVFSYPQIGALASYLAVTCADALARVVVFGKQPGKPVTEQAHPAVSEWVIPMQPHGARPALFAVPGAGANALSLQQLSRALGNDQPFYCLEPPGLDGLVPPLADVAELAALNIQGMRSIQSKGPYRLLGYSNGGVVAFEMARQLLQRREKVAGLILLDSLCPTLRDQPVEEMMAAVFKHFVHSLGGVLDLDVQRLQQVPAGERSEYLYEHIARLGLEVPQRQFLATFDVAAASERGCRAYTPVRLPQKIDVTLFCATEGFKDAPEDYGWRSFLPTPLRICHVSADHFSIVERDAVKEVAKEINRLSVNTARKAAQGLVREARYQAG